MKSNKKGNMLCKEQLIYDLGLNHYTAQQITVLSVALSHVRSRDTTGNAEQLREVEQILEKIARLLYKLEAD